MLSKDELIKIRDGKDRPLILDGAFGSLLQQRGFISDNHLWYSGLNITSPDNIIALHKEYINAGSEIITTNTFRTNPLAKRKSRLNISNYEFVKKSVALAKIAIENLNIILAGSNAPAEDCYQSERTISNLDLEYNHKKHIEMLVENGVDLILNETQSHLDEIELISKFCDENKISFIMSLYLQKDLTLLSGESVKQAIDIINSYNPLAISFNCISINILSNIVEKYQLPKNFGFYLNCGDDNYKNEELLCKIDHEEYAKEIEEFIVFNPIFIGACCGSNPLHIKSLKDKINALHRN